MVEFGGRRDSGPLDDRRSWSHVGGRVKTAHRSTPQFAHGRGLRLGTRNALSPSPTLSPCPPAARHDRAPGGPSQAPPGGRARGDDPRRRSEGRRAGENSALGEKTPGTARARTKPGGRRRRAARIRQAEGMLRTSAAFGYVPRRGGERAGSAAGDALTSPSRSSRARRRSPPVLHPHQPPPAAAARTRKDVDAEHPAQQRRPPRRTLTRRSHRRRGPSSSASGRAGMTADRHAACGASTP